MEQHQRNIEEGDNMNNLERQRADRRAVFVEHWLSNGMDVKYLTLFEKSIEHLSDELLREKLKKAHGEVISILPNTDPTADSKVRVDRARIQMGRLNDHTLQHLAEVSAQVCILQDELQHREEV